MDMKAKANHLNILSVKIIKIMSHWIGKLTDKEPSKWASRTLSTVCLNIQIDSTRNPSTEFIYLQFCIVKKH